MKDLIQLTAGQQQSYNLNLSSDSTLSYTIIAKFDVLH